MATPARKRGERVETSGLLLRAVKSSAEVAVESSLAVYISAREATSPAARTGITPLTHTPIPMLTLIGILVATATFITAVLQKRIWMQLTGIFVSGLPALAYFVIVLETGADATAAWFLFSIPMFYCLGYLFLALASSQRSAVRGFSITVVFLTAGLYGADSLMYVRFTDQHGRPIEGEAVEINHSHLGELHPIRPRSDEDGIARVGLMRMNIPGIRTSLHIQSAGGAAGAWPKEVVVWRREARQASTPVGTPY
jgi:hypothetical protein